MDSIIAPIEAKILPIFLREIIANSGNMPRSDSLLYEKNQFGWANLHLLYESQNFERYKV